MNLRLVCLALIALLAPALFAADAATARSPEDAAKLRAAGSLDVRVHDPSSIVTCNGEYWVFYTGRGIGSWRSKDLKKWEAGPKVFEAAPAWVAEIVPENRNAHFWAPDLIAIGGRYLLYYSVSSFGKNTSAIALVTNRTRDPASPDFKWVDEGVVIRSVREDRFNAIDPAIFLDADGRLWMSFGSFWSGLKLFELDPKTGKRITPDSPLHAIAYKREIEAPFLHRRGAFYYLFVNHDVCCRGVNSTYKILVGRSENIAGPYLDREGKSLMQAGGTLVLATDGPVIGPGHASLLRVGEREWFGYHFYDATQNGRSTFALRPLTWDADGWPVVGEVAP
jgi:arabinan endo-1,5-alpha-L-arabinosidase